MLSRTGRAFIRHFDNPNSQLRRISSVVCGRRRLIQTLPIAATQSNGKLGRPERLSTLQISQRLMSESAQEQIMDKNEYERISEDTLHELTDFFEGVFEEIENDELDISLSSGVLTIRLGNDLGTYVINKQTPNRQIWLSSPTSGPKRYDFTNGQWIYSHDGSNLYELLEVEFSKALHVKVCLENLEYYHKR